MRWSTPGGAALVMLVAGCNTLGQPRAVPSTDGAATSKRIPAGPDVEKVRPFYEAACGTPGEPPRGSFRFRITLAQGDSPLELEGEGEGLEPATEQRLTAALVQHQGGLLACVANARRGAELQLRASDTGELEPRPRHGLDESERECLRAAVGTALAGIDRGRADRIVIQVTPARDLRGSLSKEHIRQTIRGHIGEVRACYELGLVEAPDMEGRVAIKFIIAPSGEVSVAAVANTTLAHERTECCIARSVRTWRFDPPAGGGIVVVTYPFVLRQVP